MQSDHGADLSAALYVALGRLVRGLRQEAPSSQVGPGGLSAMVTLGGRGPMRVGELAQVEGVAAASMTRIVNHLDQIGLASRAPDPTDGRAQVVQLTVDGTDLLETGQEAKLSALRRRIEALPAADRAALSAAMSAFEQLGGAVLTEQ